MFHWMWFLWQWGIICFQWFLNLSLPCIRVRPEPLALTQCCITWELSLLKLDSGVLRWGCRAQRKTEGQVVLGSMQPAGTLASLDGNGLIPNNSTFTSYHSLIPNICHSCRTVHAVSFVFCQSEKSCFLWSLLLCNMSNCSILRPLEELENWLVLKSTQGEFRISLSFVSLEICCWLQQAWGEQQLLFHFCFANSEAPSLTTRALIMKLSNLWFFRYCLQPLKTEKLNFM